MSDSEEEEDDFEEVHDTFSVHDITTEKREGLAIGYRVCRELRIKPKKIRKTFAAFGYPINERTWREWVSKLEQVGHTHSAQKRSGAERKLTDTQVRFFVGWVLHQNSLNVPVHVDDGIRCIQTHFGITLSHGTVQSLFVDNGFSSRLMQHRTAGYKLNHDDRAQK